MESVFIEALCQWQDRRIEAAQSTSLSRFIEECRQHPEMKVDQWIKEFMSDSNTRLMVSSALRCYTAEDETYTRHFVDMYNLAEDLRQELVDEEELP